MNKTYKGLPKEESIFVTQPDLPDFELYVEKLKEIWANKILTNNGPIHSQFEQGLKDYLGVQNMSVYSNGTIALLAALRALNIKGEVITTPFSFVATAHSILWNNLTPVFADVDPGTGNLDPKSVEEKINKHTSAIMPVHVYGNPCDIPAFNSLKNTYNLKLIYDAAHCFGVQKQGRSILEEGDLSIVSFHATKAFNSIEGGAIVSKDPKLIEKLNLFKNFGFRNELEIEGYGINGKMNEFQAAFGLLQLDIVANNILKRKQVFSRYNTLLNGIEGLRFVEFSTEYSMNYSYMPIIVEDSYLMSRDELYNKLKENHIFSRRYFYPLISNLEKYNELPSSDPENLKNANYLGDRILCLPIYSELEEDILVKICNILRC